MKLIAASSMSTAIFVNAIIMAALVQTAAADDTDDCHKLSGQPALEACTRGINSGRYQGETLAWLYHNRAFELNAIGEKDRALSDAEEALRVMPSHKQSHVMRGSILSDRKEYALALEAFSQALRIDPKYSLAYFNRGIVHAALGRDDLAIKEYSDALLHNSEHSDSYYRRGLSYFKRGDRDRAIADFRHAIGANPSHEGARRDLESLGAKP